MLKRRFILVIFIMVCLLPGIVSAGWYRDCKKKRIQVKKDRTIFVGNPANKNPHIHFGSNFLNYKEDRNSQHRVIKSNYRDEAICANAREALGMVRTANMEDKSGAKKCLKSVIKDHCAD